MKQQRGFLVQIGGSGKGCGKTTLIIRLLAEFPGSVYIKSAYHTNVTQDGGDQQRCLNAGAAYSMMIPQTEPGRLAASIRRFIEAGHLVFLEKNARIPRVPADLYIFVEGSVRHRRDDADTLKQSADWIAEGETFDPADLGQMIRSRYEAKFRGWTITRDLNPRES